MRVHRVLFWLVLACLIWAGVSWLASANLDGYNDMLENYAWAQPLRWGTHKHPPFFAWVVGLLRCASERFWLLVLPLTVLEERSKISAARDIFLTTPSIPAVMEATSRST